MKEYLHRTVAALFLATFAVMGARGIILRNPGAPVIDGTGSECCVDAMLKLYFQVSDGSQLIAGHLSKLPPGLPVVILYPKSDPLANLASQMVGRAAWPRQALMVPINPATPRRFVENLRNQPIGGMLFCSLAPPPSLPERETVLPGLVLIPVEAR